MSATEDPVERFSAAAASADALVHRTSVEGAEETIEDLTRRPAVGAPLPFEDVSLPADVETDPEQETLKAATTGITAAVLGITSYGSVAVVSGEDREGPVSLYPKRQIAVVRADDLVADVPTALERLEERFLGGRNDAVLVTGPSTTGDMGELVTGVHGPAELHVVVIEG